MPDALKRERGDFLVLTDLCHDSYAPARHQVARAIEAIVERCVPNPNPNPNPNHLARVIEAIVERCFRERVGVRVRLRLDVAEMRR